MLYRLEFPAGFTVAMTSPVAGFAVRPFAWPATSHWATTEPPAVNSTMVLSRLPDALACPCAPTPFVNEAYRLPPYCARPDGSLSSSDFPVWLFLCFMFQPYRTSRTW